MTDKCTTAAAALVLGAALAASAGDWPDWRGPARNGRSSERGLPDRWTPGGQGQLWRAPYGGRSAPVVLGERVFVQNAVGEGAERRERVLCLDATSGRLLWEHRFNVYLSDVPPHRVGWAAPSADPATGNVYAFGVGGHLLGLTNQGKVLWERSLAEDFGLVTTHGGRTVSPVVDGDLVIVSGVTAGWGAQARAAHRFIAVDKRTGETVWVNTPGGRPFDTTYSPPVIATVAGARLFIAGGSDGAVHALRPQTGESVWRFEASKRGLNTGAVVHGSTAIVSHSEENYESSDMGLLAALDATAKGPLGKEQVRWAIRGIQGGFSSPVLDGDRLYQVDNGANLFAFDATSGRQLFTHNLGTIQKASLVLADGKLYVGTENGRFFILRPKADGVEVLDDDALGSEAAPEAILAGVAVSRGRIFLVSSEAVYAIGRRQEAPAEALSAPEPAPKDAAPALVQVTPTELVLKPGERARFTARLFDDKGRFLREEAAPAWSLAGLTGTIDPKGQLTAAEGAAQAGSVKATVGTLAGEARVRVIPKLPWSFDFEGEGGVPAHWVNATGKFAVREVAGHKALVKLADNPATKRARVFMGSSGLSDYTVEADVLSHEQRRQMADAGLVAQRYSLVLFGNHQRLELESWQPETQRTVSAPFAWKPDVWYRLKLRVESLPEGKTRAVGKAWPVGEAEPAGWTLERVDPIGNRQGSPGLYADASVEVVFDNVKVVTNQ